MASIRLASHTHDLGDGFRVRRLLPAPEARAVGPFVCFDHMGPVEFAPGQGLDLRPHPHIGLAAVTFLFEGVITHRDSLGTVRDIRPGDVNWMLAGRGIVHSERSPQAERAAGHRLHGIQTWLALPLADEEAWPDFVHVPAESLPQVRSSGVRLRVIAGDAFGQTSPVPVRSPTLYVAAEIETAAHMEVPLEHEQRAVYVVSGSLTADGEPLNPGDMLVLPPRPVRLRALEPTCFVLVGGDALDLGPENTAEHPRHLRWNFVSSRQERLEEAVQAWSRQDVTAFPPVPGETECIAYP
jgi:redox-sensitive bicupin YhaK (pirin superfamily)